MKTVKFLFLLSVFSAVRAQIPALSFGDSLPPEILALELTRAMSDEEALAQVFMLGWVGAEPSPLIMDWIRDRHIGGIKIFGWNTGDTRRLAQTVGELQKASLAGNYGIPLLVATDQEGGWIRHVKGNTSETPGNMAIGASGVPRDAYLSGYYIAKELALLGINMNFAPTVDLFTNRESTLIGTRAFGSDPVQTGILGAAFMKGQQAAGVIPTAKHYPGHGDTGLDSHGVLPRIGATFEELWDRELSPYRIMAKEGLPAVMSGHLSFPNTQAADTPASLSSYFLDEVLRGQIGFKGLIITDDLMMNGATTWAGSISKVARQALMSGNDVIMLSKTPSLFDPVWTTLQGAMKTDEAFRNRVRDACRRTLKLKLQYLRGETSVPPIPDLKKIENELPDPKGSAFFLDLAARSVTVIKPTAIPINAEEAGRVLLAGQYEDFFQAGRRAFPGAVSYWYSSSRGTSELASYARSADTIIFCLSDGTGLSMLRSLEPLKKRIIVLSVLNPVYLEQVSWVDAILAVYSYASESFIAGFSVILGRVPGRGRLPYE
ncbi:MAG: glycoside hydrolase family 3 protein [Treponema sp.]|jgi:beta-N-acetylhexosaminidase|nr:glycoside hydrolase family 3 protein [Treponema sp.]